MKYFVTVNGEEHEVELTERLGELSVGFDGEPLNARYQEVDRLGQVALYVDDESYAISIEGNSSSAAVTVADTISAVVAVPRVTVDDAPEPAADTARPPFALATLMPTPKARASICCLDSAVSEMSPPAATLPVSIAARTVFVTSTSLLAAPTVTPTAAL